VYLVFKENILIAILLKRGNKNVALLVLGQFSDIYENWPRTIRATVPQLIKT
jgi:hypothetical protein